MLKTLRYALLAMVIAALLLGSIWAFAQAPPSKGESSYSPVVIKEAFEAIMTRMKTAKPEIMKRQMDLLSARYDLNNRPAQGVAMSVEKRFRKAFG